MFDFEFYLIQIRVGMKTIFQQIIAARRCIFQTLHLFKNRLFVSDFLPMNKTSARNNSE